MFQLDYSIIFFNLLNWQENMLIVLKVAALRRVGAWSRTELCFNTALE